MRVLYSISVFCCIVSVYGWESVCMFVCAMKILSFYCTRCACSSINAFLMFVCVWAFHLCIFVYKTCIHPCQFCEYRPRDIHSHALTHVHNHSHKHGEAHNVPHTRLAVPLLLLLLCHFYVSPFLPPPLTAYILYKIVSVCGFNTHSLFFPFSLPHLPLSSSFSFSNLDKFSGVQSG